MRPLFFSLIFVAVIAGIAVAAHPFRPWLDSPACPAWRMANARPLTPRRSRRFLPSQPRRHAASRRVSTSRLGVCPGGLLGC